MNPIRNPFSRDEYPALTDAINGVVNGQPRPVEDPITEDAMTAERDAELRGKMKREKDYGEYRKLRAQREKEAKSKKLYGKGGKIDTSRKPDVSKSKQIWEAVTRAQQGVFNRERERMMTALNNPKKKLSPTEREAVLARGARNAAAEVRKGAVSPTGKKSPVHAQAKAHHEYARKESKKMDAIAKRKGVQEDVQNVDRWQEAETEKRRAHEDLARAKAAHKKKSSDATLRKIRKAEDRIRDIGYKHRDEHESPNIYGRGGKVVGRQWSRDDPAPYHGDR